VRQSILKAESYPISFLEFYPRHKLLQLLLRQWLLLAHLVLLRQHIVDMVKDRVAVAVTLLRLALRRERRETVETKPKTTADLTLT
jgi:hypothetical protein